MTEHLPEVVRWSEYVDGMVISPTGYFVTYADHVAAVAEAEQRGQQMGEDAVFLENYVFTPESLADWSLRESAKGYAAALDAARDQITARMATEPDIPRRTGMGYAVEEINRLREAKP